MHFKTCESVFVQSASQLSIDDYSQTVIRVDIRIWERFRYFKNYELKFEMFSELFDLSVEKANEKLKMELIAAQCDRILKQKFCDVCVPSFYSFLPRGWYPKIVGFAYRVCAKFGSTCANSRFRLRKGTKHTTDHGWRTYIVNVILNPRFAALLPMCQLSGKSKGLVFWV
jgi:hypothetical protein